LCPADALDARASAEGAIGGGSAREGARGRAGKGGKTTRACSSQQTAVSRRHRPPPATAPAPPAHAAVPHPPTHQVASRPWQPIISLRRDPDSHAQCGTGTAGTARPALLVPSLLPTGSLAAFIGAAAAMCTLAADAADTGVVLGAEVALGGFTSPAAN